MNLMRLAFVAVVTTCLCSGASAADNKKLIVGKWEVTKADPDTVPVGAIVEFKADGKMKLVAKKDGKELVAEGTYTVDADSFTFKLTVEGQEQSKKIIIKKLDKKELDTRDPDDKAVTCKRLK